MEAEDNTEQRLLTCPVCKTKHSLEIGLCEVFNGYVGMLTYKGQEYEVCCLTCGATGEGETAEEAERNIKPNKCATEIRS